MSKKSEAENQVRQVLEDWASATRQNRIQDVLRNHAVDLLIFDVLAPMKYESAEAYRRSWGDWQPDVRGDAVFELEHLEIKAGSDVAFAHCLINCGGIGSDGRSFSDTVRATFCLERLGDDWQVSHQHVSKPLQRS